MAACQGGLDPYNCPPIMCPGCPRVVIHSQGRAQLCPVCGGSGGHCEWPQYSNAAGGVWKTCHGCQGKGWVTV